MAQQRAGMPFGSASSLRVHNDDLPRRAILDECDRLNGSLWEDRVFAAQGDHCLYLPGSKTRYAGGQKIKWLRPNEVAGAGGKPIELIKDGADAGDVIQGELGDCYLLGAMSSIAAKGMLSRLLWSEADVAGDLKRGFITFKLYKFGEWVQVSVDTLLPCNAADECIFAHAKDPTEVRCGGPAGRSGACVRARARARRRVSGLRVVGRHRCGSLCWRRRTPSCTAPTKRSTAAL